MYEKRSTRRPCASVQAVQGEQKHQSLDLAACAAFIIAPMDWAMYCGNSASSEKSTTFDQLAFTSSALNFPPMNAPLDLCTRILANQPPPASIVSPLTSDDS